MTTVAGAVWNYPLGVPNGYCGLEGTGVGCPVGLGVTADAKA